ncbi:RDD family protein [Salinibacterium sp. SWN1162]|uniref:RDD family protein n=1 Tax=Salinibacterium sp. SWN1162 TaxID=2792053 RepID=UPI0018CFDC4F|nr:RDD family protein [Salinibacterium sp. SWN1162]MBH0009222.1 RDD family protein [Salinibacterium sp. SWN1162]
MNQQAATSDDWPGKRIGLPAEGPRSIGRLGRRLVALAIDWGFAVVVSIAFFEYEAFATLGIFVAAQVVLLITANGSFGHLITGMRVVPVTGGFLGIWRPIVRTVLMALVIPAVIWDADQRGMHDRVAGTLLVRR